MMKYLLFLKNKCKVFLLGSAGVELIFFIVTDMGLIFGFVLRSVIITYGQYMLLLSRAQTVKGFSASHHPTGEQAGGAQEAKTDSRGIPHHMASCSGINWGGGWSGDLLLRDWLGIGQLVVSSCRFILHHLFFLGFISVIFAFY